MRILYLKIINEDAEMRNMFKMQRDQADQDKEKSEDWLKKFGTWDKHVESLKQNRENNLRQAEMLKQSGHQDLARQYEKLASQEQPSSEERKNYELNKAQHEQNIREYKDKVSQIDQLKKTYEQNNNLNNATQSQFKNTPDTTQTKNENKLKMMNNIYKIMNNENKLSNNATKPATISNTTNINNNK